MRRDPLGALVVILIIAVFGTFVWMTRHPESEILAAAEEWPGVGPLVEAFRSRYSSRPTLQQGEDVPAQGSPVDSAPRTAGETVVGHLSTGVWVRGGTQLHVAADSRSDVIARVGRDSRLPVVEYEVDWYHVLHQGRAAWVRLPGYGEGDEPPLGREPSAPLPLPGRPADQDLLRTALEQLAFEPAPSSLGEYELFTDHDDLRLLQWLDDVAARVEPLYVQRYGLSPVDRPRESIVLYASEAGYRRLQNSLERVAGLPAVGLMSRGLVAIFAGGRSHTEIAATLVHELAHLINRRALGPALPPWLDEGIADDLAYSAINEKGELDPGQLAGFWRDVGPTRIWWGGQAAALEMSRALEADRSVPLQQLVQLDWEPFVDPEQRLHYPQSAFFVRYLLDSDFALREGFQRYLGGVARGGAVTPEALLENLGRSWSELEADFQTWLPAKLAGLSANGSRVRDEG